MLEEFNHWGYINIEYNYECVKTKISAKDEDEKGDDHPSLNLTRHYAYEYADGNLKIHAFERIPELNGNKVVLGYSFDNVYYLFCSQIPMDMLGLSMYPQNYNWKIDYVIKGYEKGSKYSEAVFDFDELQYFCPSSVSTQTWVHTIKKTRIAAGFREIF